MKKFYKNLAAVALIVSMASNSFLCNLAYSQEYKTTTS